MSSFRIFDIAGAGMSAQSVRLNTVASNLANAESVNGDPATVYNARHPVFKAETGAAGELSASVSVAGITESNAAPSKRYDPGHPLANAQRYVLPPNVNSSEEMEDMISASR